MDFPADPHCRGQTRIPQQDKFVRCDCPLHGLLSLQTMHNPVLDQNFQDRLHDLIFFAGWVPSTGVCQNYPHQTLRLRNLLPTSFSKALLRSAQSLSRSAARGGFYGPHLFTHTYFASPGTKRSRVNWPSSNVGTFDPNEAQRDNGGSEKGRCR